MAKIFISYRRADSTDAAGRIYDRLVAAFGEANVFKDVDSIPLGSDFADIIAEQIKDCDAVIVVIGRFWLTIRGQDGTPRLQNPMDFVRIEIEEGLNSRALIIPAMVGNVTMPREEQLPKSIRGLTRKHAISIRPDPDFHRDMDRLIRGLQEHFKRKYPLPTPATVPIPDLGQQEDAEQQEIPLVRPKKVQGNLPKGSGQPSSSEQTPLPIPSRWWRLAAPGNMLMLLLLFSFPWIEIGCRGENENSSEFGLYSQSGFQAIYGGHREYDHAYDTSADREFREAKDTWLPKVMAKSEINSAPMLAFCFGLISAGAITGLALPLGGRRLKVIGGCSLAAVLLLLTQTAVGFPAAKTVQAVNDYEREHGDLNKQRNFFIEYQPGYYLTWSVLLTSFGLVLEEWLLIHRGYRYAAMAGATIGSNSDLFPESGAGPSLPKARRLRALLLQDIANPVLRNRYLAIRPLTLQYEDAQWIPRRTSADHLINIVILLVWAAGLMVSCAIVGAQFAMLVFSKTAFVDLRGLEGSFMGACCGLLLLEFIALYRDSTRRYRLFILQRMLGPLPFRAHRRSLHQAAKEYLGDDSKIN